MRKITSLWVMAALLSGCVTLSTLDTSATIDNAGDESIVVIGVRPEYMISLQNGPLSNGEFHPRTVMSEHFLIASPKGNYLVAKIKANSPGEAVGVVGVTASNSLWFNPAKFKPCNSFSPVFTVPRGKVIYIGDVSYAMNGSKLDLQTSQDFASAREFVDNNYPNLKGLLSEAPFDMLRVVGVSCFSTQFIPIYIPRGK
jgi:hypothetical protein